MKHPKFKTVGTWAGDRQGDNEEAWTVPWFAGRWFLDWAVGPEHLSHKKQAGCKTGRSCTGSWP